MEFVKRYLPIAGLLVIVIGVQLLTSATDTAYYLTQLTMAAYYSLLIIGLCVLMGYAGQISLGHAGFFAIGGYLSAALTSNDFSAYRETAVMRFMDTAGLLMHRQSLYGEPLLNIQPWPACIIAVVVAIIIAFLLGIPVLKLKGHYLAMATLGFGIIIFRVALAAEFFGEADGISEVPPFQLFPGVAVTGDFSERVENY
jgi:branched-chain amino acid transport system permease protein